MGNSVLEIKMIEVTMFMSVHGFGLKFELPPNRFSLPFLHSATENRNSFWATRFWPHHHAGFHAEDFLDPAGNEGSQPEFSRRPKSLLFLMLYITWERIIPRATLKHVVSPYRTKVFDRSQFLASSRF